MNCGDLAQDLRFAHGSVVLGHAVATRDPARIVFFNQAVDKEPAVACDQQDVAGNNLIAGLVLDAENIARPDRRQHAGAESVKAKRASRSQEVGGEIEFMTLANLGGHGGPDLGTLAIEAALKFGRADFAAG